ncbi:MAG: hypothetical protein A3K65_04100 [Euryarchaeota archaeon RBG_16_68_12]|nr:MAG: hypothetical protein A3K65_04100 [Euryarchaeota archaeon RBG_16_68_12]
MTTAFTVIDVTVVGELGSVHGLPIEGGGFVRSRVIFVLELIVFLNEFARYPYFLTSNKWDPYATSEIVHAYAHSNQSHAVEHLYE